MGGFVDREREVAKEFEGITKLLKEGKVEEVKGRAEELIGKDPYFLESYLLLSEIYEMEGRFEEAQEILRKAYTRAIELLGGNFPERLEWRYPTNRHIINALVGWGTFLWEIGKLEEALGILKEVYRMNPTDEPGVRFYILAILEGMGFEEFEQTFSKEGEYDLKELEDWFERKSKDHPELLRLAL